MRDSKHPREQALPTENPVKELPMRKSDIYAVSSIRSSPPQGWSWLPWQ